MFHLILPIRNDDLDTVKRGRGYGSVLRIRERKEGKRGGKCWFSGGGEEEGIESELDAASLNLEADDRYDSEEVEGPKKRIGQRVG
jgi:hypothetical protein